MSEYWVSKGKYWCKYCKIFVADDKPSRQHHETGFKHKGSLERYIRDIYKKGMQSEKDKAEEEREMKAIEAAAARAMGQSAEASTSRSSSSASAESGKRIRPSAPAGDTWSRYSTAESLGYIDEEAARLAEEQKKRQEEGYAGEWSIVSGPSSNSKGKKRGSTEAEEAEADDEERKPSATTEARRNEEDPERRPMSFSHFKEKSLPTGDDEDLDSIVIKVKKPKEMRDVDPLAKAMRQAQTQAPPGNGKRPSGQNGKMMFKPVVPQADQEGEETPEEAAERNQAAWDLIAPKEEVKSEGSPAPDAPLFKKRKTGASSAAKRR